MNYRKMVYFLLALILMISSCDSLMEIEKNENNISKSLTSQAKVASIEVDVDFSLYMQIHTVQGAGHVSPLTGQNIKNLIGVVTAKDGKGFWMQSPQPDNDPRTSEGILVYLRKSPTISVGDLVVVEGKVKEFGYGKDLRLTELVYPKIVEVLQSNYPLPEPIILGEGGRILPNSIINNDANGDLYNSLFDPEEDGIDFYESIENMYVQVNDALAVAGDKYGEIPVLADNGKYGRMDRWTRRGGVAISKEFYNPNIINIDTDSYILRLPALKAKTGDKFTTPIFGVIGYSYGKFLLLPTILPPLTSNSLEREVTELEYDNENLTVATFNIENFPRDDAKMTAEQIQDKILDISETIVKGLKNPDIIAIVEMTDDSYSNNNGVVKAEKNYNDLIDTIFSIGGPDSYDFREIAPENNKEGGWPGANIRVGFLFNTKRVSFKDIGNGTATENALVLNNNGNADISLSPGRVNVESFGGSRKPLIGKFSFQGETIFVIANHFNSKSGDNALFGLNQPPVLGSEPERMVQASAINDFVNQLLTVQRDANVIVAGDLNDFQFSNPLNTLKGNTLYNLTEQLLDTNEQYTYTYNGNSQQLDHILVSKNLMDSDPKVDIVHRYSEFSSQLRHSDHDPLVASFEIDD